MENKPLKTDPPVPDVSTEEGDKNVNPVVESLTLDEANTLMGRKYATAEELKKGLAEQTSYVGKLGPKAAEYDKIQAEKTPEQNQTDINVQTQDSVAKIDFLIENPGAKTYADKIQIIAKAERITMSEVYKDSLFEKAVKKEMKSQEPAVSQGIDSGRLPKGQEALTPEKFHAMPMDEAKKIVEGLPTYTQPISKR